MGSQQDSADEEYLNQNVQGNDKRPMKRTRTHKQDPLSESIVKAKERSVLREKLLSSNSQQLTRAIIDQTKTYFVK
jgi:hypothetical protein